jgi:hypothetical protein
MQVVEAPPREDSIQNFFPWPGGLPAESSYPYSSTVFPQLARRDSMTDYREINALQRDPERARRLARFLRALADIAWTDWEIDFLQDMADRMSEEDLSTRQAEKLVELRDASVWYEKVDGFSVRLLVKNCCEMRHLLCEHDEDFVVRLKNEGAMKLRRREAARLMRRARTTGEIEPYHGWSLEKTQVEEAA